ncbi:hypothetical protein ABZP36_024313 [Zizania latifolia]
MGCFSCFKPDKKMASSKTAEARQVAAVQTVSTKHGAPLKKSESSKLPRVSSNHKRSSEAAASTEPPKGNPVTPKTGKAFTFRELAIATDNFRSDCLLGEGGFGRVYKGQLENGQLVAVKQLDLNGLQGNAEFLVEVMVLGLLRHPNLMPLITKLIQVYSDNSVHDYLALGRKINNLMQQGLITRIVIADNTPDQVPLTVDTSRPASDQVLVKWAKPMLKDRRRYHELVDPLLRGDYPKKHLDQAVGVAAMCLQEEDSVRPYMSDAVVTLGFLAEVPAGDKNKQAEEPSVTGSPKQDQGTFDRQRAVAEAIEWGTMRQKQKDQTQEKKAKSQGIIAPIETNRL